MEYVTPERLLEVLNKKLYELEACPDWKFRRPPHGPKKPDANGCNWSDIVDIRGTMQGVWPYPTACHLVGSRAIQLAPARLGRPIYGLANYITALLPKLECQRWHRPPNISRGGSGSPWGCRALDIPSPRQ